MPDVVFLSLLAVFLILIRDVDLVTPVHHTSGYQALIDDLLDLQLNRVTVSLKDKSGAKKRKTYSLDPEVDNFWVDHAGKLFPEAVEANGGLPPPITSFVCHCHCRSRCTRLSSSCRAVHLIVVVCLNALQELR